MTTLLVIQAHPHIENSLSLTVGKRFIDSYKKNPVYFSLYMLREGTDEQFKRVYMVS